MLKTDKDFWHRYVPEYERVIFNQYSRFSPENIMEFGVSHGYSIQWLADKFPTTHIYGVDILEPNKGWPQSQYIHYYKADQSDKIATVSMFMTIGKKFDVIIDDGSHVSDHQVNCLLESLPYVKSNGFYVIEDIHVSYSRTSVTIFNVLLALKRFQDLGDEKMSPAFFKSLGHVPLTFQQIVDLNDRISSIHTYRRSSLPLLCWACRRPNFFDYKELKCSCGQDLLPPYDSMSFILRIA